VCPPPFVTTPPRQKNKDVAARRTGRFRDPHSPNVNTSNNVASRKPEPVDFVIRFGEHEIRALVRARANANPVDFVIR
jgi:hypothetical protein